MVLKGLNHVAIAVRDIDDAANYFAEVFGAERRGAIEVRQDHGVKVCFLSIGDSMIELLEPLAPENTIARFIERNGEKVHHVCFETDDIEADIETLAARGVEPIDSAPRLGLDGRVAFLHPRSTRGILIELVQKPNSK